MNGMYGEKYHTWLHTYVLHYEKLNILSISYLFQLKFNYIMRAAIYILTVTVRYIMTFNYVIKHYRIQRSESAIDHGIEQRWLHAIKLRDEMAIYPGRTS